MVKRKKIWNKQYKNDTIDDRKKFRFEMLMDVLKVHDVVGLILSFDFEWRLSVVNALNSIELMDAIDDDDNNEIKLMDCGIEKPTYSVNVSPVLCSKYMVHL